MAPTSTRPLRAFPVPWPSPSRRGGRGKAWWPVAWTGGVLLCGLLAGQLPGLLSTPLEAQDEESAKPRITDFHITLENRQALASFRLAHAVDQRFLERVDSGLPTAFVFRFQLVKIRRGWFDNTLDTTTLQVVTMYDAVERRYLVNFKLGGKLVRSETVHDPAELEAMMTRFEKQPVFALETLPAEARMHVRLRGELGAKTIFSLIPARITTPWVESRRFRPAEANP